MAKKLNKEDKELLQNFTKGLMKVPVMAKDKDGKWFIPLQTVIYSGSACIANNFNGGKNNQGQPFIVGARYKWELPRYYQPYEILKAAFLKGGKNAVLEAFKGFLKKENIYREYLKEQNKETLPKSKVEDLNNSIKD